jgi:hypothetical protein
MKIEKRIQANCSEWNNDVESDDIIVDDIDWEEEKSNILNSLMKELERKEWDK